MQKIAAMLVGFLLGALALAGTASANGTGGTWCGIGDHNATKVDHGITYQCLRDGNRWRWIRAEPSASASASTSASSSPASSSRPASPSAATSQPATLPTTGPGVMLMLVVGSGLMFFGTLAYLIASRRRRTRFTA